MILTSDQVDLKQNATFGPNSLHFVFKGKFTKETSEISIDAWRKHAETSGRDGFVVIWDCQQMKGFEYYARKAWVDYMKSKEDSIVKVIFVSNDVATRGSAYLILKPFNVETQVVKSIDEFAMTVA